MRAPGDRQEQTLTPLPTELAPAILGRLQAEGIASCEAWRALGPKCGRIFGITRKMRKRIDRAVAVALERGRP